LIGVTIPQLVRIISKYTFQHGKLSVIEFFGAFFHVVLHKRGIVPSDFPLFAVSRHDLLQDGNLPNFARKSADAELQLAMEMRGERQTAKPRALAPDEIFVRHPKPLNTIRTGRRLLPPQ
jgi:hypothetical protein